MDNALAKRWRAAYSIRAAQRPVAFAAHRWYRFRHWYHLGDVMTVAAGQRGSPETPRYPGGSFFNSLRHYRQIEGGQVARSPAVPKADEWPYTTYQLGSPPESGCRYAE
jgi:hypothetical protein